MPILLLATVGGTPQPLVASLLSHCPDRVHFVVSADTAALPDSSIVPAASAHGLVLSAGQYECHCLSDPQDFALCLQEVARLRDVVEKWTARGSGYGAVVDFTGGTKAMTAALACASLRWPVQYSYVGGAARDKGGVGVVVDGKEQVRHLADPLEVEAYLDLELYVALFNGGEYAGAGSIAERLRNRYGPGPGKIRWSALTSLAEAYSSWDRFQYSKAKDLLEACLRHEASMREVLGEGNLWGPAGLLRGHITMLSGLRCTLSMQLLRDLLSNARRCAERGRWDDATSRLYRAVEAIAQFRLQDQYDIATGSVRIDGLPAAVREQASLLLQSAGRGAPVQWGLQQAYLALRAWDDPLGHKFAELFPCGQSVLETRNSSLLAHGFDPVSEKSYKQLWSGILKLASELSISERDLAQFPRLPARSSGGQREAGHSGSQMGGGE